MPRPSQRLLTLRRLCLPAVALFPWGAMGEAPLRIDIFTTRTQPVTVGTVAANPAVDLRIIEVDAIQRLDAALSERLPDDPASAKHEVLERLASLDQEALGALQKSATGLAKAMQFGVDRTPAVVFAETAVVYGVTDVSAALSRYRDWDAQHH